MYDLIIIGADSAGLTAGIYAGRKKINAIILTKKLGGQSLYTDSIENYPGFTKISGTELVNKLKEQVANFGIEIKENEEVVGIEKKDGGFLVKSSTGQYEAVSVVVATGQHWRELKIPGEKELVGRGVSICAICDAPFYKDKNVAVIGGGNSAFDSAYDLLKFANKIYILQHRDEFKGDRSMQEKLKQSGKVEFITNARTKEIKGSRFVESLIYEDVKSGDTKELKVDGVFVNIGQIPNSVFVEGLLDLNKFKEIVIDKDTNQTSVPGIFSAGDVTNIRYKQNIVAAAEGAKTTLSVYEYLSR